MKNIEQLQQLFYDGEKDPQSWEDGEVQVTIFFKDGSQLQGWIDDYDNFQPDDGDEFFSYEELLSSAKGYEKR